MEQEINDLELLYGKGDKHVVNTSLKVKILSSFIDYLLTVIIFFSLFLSVGTLMINKIAESDINSINEEYADICEIYDYPYANGGNYNLYIIDQEKFVASIKDDITTEEKYDEYFKAVDKVNESLYKRDAYKKAYVQFQNKYLITTFICAFVASFVIYLIIPLYLKTKTISMKLLKISQSNSNDFEIASYKKLFIRYFILYILNFVIFQFMFNILTLIFIPLINLVMICANKNHSTLSELLSKTRVINDQNIGIKTE